MLRWKLKETMDMHKVTRYALQKETGLAMNTLRSLYDGVTRRPDLEVLNVVIYGLRRLTGEKIGICDVLEWQG